MLRNLISALHPPPLLPKLLEAALLEIALRRVSASKDQSPPKQRRAGVFSLVRAQQRTRVTDMTEQRRCDHWGREGEYVQKYKNQGA